jgi:hypothetical protein
MYTGYLISVLCAINRLVKIQRLEKIDLSFFDSKEILKLKTQNIKMKLNKRGRLYAALFVFMRDRKRASAIFHFSLLPTYLFAAPNSNK